MSYRVRNLDEKTARGIAAACEARPGNPALTEVRVHGSRCLGDPNRITPRYGVSPVWDESGRTVGWEVSAPDDGWAKPQIEALYPSREVERRPVRAVDPDAERETRR